MRTQVVVYFSGFIQVTVLIFQLEGKNMKYKIIALGTGMALTGIAAFSPMPAYAFDGSDVSSFVSELATKLGIQKETVQTAVDSIRTSRQEKRMNAFEGKLSQLVKDGKLTEAQKTLILNKRKELQTKWNTERTELEAWAKQNNIDMKYLFGFGRHGKRMGMGIAK